MNPNSTRRVCTNIIITNKNKSKRKITKFDNRQAEEIQIEKSERERDKNIVS